MRTIVSLYTSLALVFLVPSALRADEKQEGKKEAQVKLKLEKGGAAEYLVKREGSTSGSSSRGEFKGKNESEVSYRIEVAEQKDGGELVLKVTLPKARARIEGRDEPWEFDSAKPDSGGEAGSQLREVLSKTLTVTIRDGAIKEVSGLPEPPSADGGGGQGNFRLGQARRVLGRERLRRDLGLILASSVQGKALEKGKEYVTETTEERDTAGQEKGRRGFFRGAAEGPLSLQFEGEETVGSKKAARFKIEPKKPAGGQGNTEVKGEGKALVSLEDGLLLSLDLSSSSKTEGERDGNTFKFNQEQKVRIERKGDSSEKPKSRAEL
jgi:hypothetical protein